jgi:hypothetical protein
MTSSTSPTPPRRLRLRYPGTCATCGRTLAIGGEAIYDPRTKEVRCLTCDADPSIDGGTPGGSARREFERRVEKRETRIKARLGQRVGGLFVRLTDEPQTTMAWQVGAAGEEKLGRALAGVPSITALHDRRVPGSKANIDHIVVGPAGVFVIDAKHLQGRIGIHNKGGLFMTDLRLIVGRRDCSALADAVLWQAGIVATALSVPAVNPRPPIVPVLVFVDGDWPLLRRPTSFRGVLLESERSIAETLLRRPSLDEQEVEHLSRVLARALPGK